MNLGPEAIKAIQILSMYKKKSLTFHLDEYRLILDILVYCNESISESKQKFPDWWTYSDTIVTKFVMHSNTLYNIGLGNTLSSVYFKEFDKNKFIDIPSLKIILRAQLESFLMFYYLYVNPSSDDEKEFRFNAWMYTSLIERTLMVSNSAFAIQQKQSDLASLDSLKKDIEKSAYFNHLSVNQRNTFLRKGSARLFKTWKNILAETGFNDNSTISVFYSLLSNYAHTEGLSVLQIKQSNFAYDDKNEQANFNVFLSKQLLCLMISTLTKMYGVVKDRFDLLSDEYKYTVSIYSAMSKR